MLELKKTMLFLMLFLLFGVAQLAPVFAQNNVVDRKWCLSSFVDAGTGEYSVQHIADVLHTSVENVFNVVGNDSSCECFPSSIVSQSDPVPFMCINNQTGYLKYKYSVVEKLAPDCVDTVSYDAFIVKQDDRCKVCPEPVKVSEPVFVKCEKGKAIYRSDAIGYLFSPSGKCVKVNKSVFELYDSANCSNPVLQYVSFLKPHWLEVLFVLLVFAIYIVEIRKRR